ncbi:hypothetical protein Nepgr_031348 [Nepenthes gracilis]|uniref:Uncharacterized protein n=1 Tax=Nepenthes gracilis TaxID=150966 RepID=A0AAD3Y6R0_NEPGR|nr:hypothetical protein Nepgr_031348 [Nepenthes gracilis]
MAAPPGTILVAAPFLGRPVISDVQTPEIVQAAGDPGVSCVGASAVRCEPLSEDEVHPLVGAAEGLVAVGTVTILDPKDGPASCSLDLDRFLVEVPTMHDSSSGVLKPSLSTPLASDQVLCNLASINQIDGLPARDLSQVDVAAVWH